MDVRVLASSSAGNCIHISNGSSNLLLDCGMPWKWIQQSLDWKMSELDGVLVSHEHL